MSELLGTNGTRGRMALFGGPALEWRGGAVKLTSLQAALLGVVYGHGQKGISRSRLAWLLWEADDDARARHRISQLLYGLSKRTGGVTLCLAEGDELRPDLDRVESDLDEFERAAEGGRLSEARRILERGFLGGLTTSPTGEYNDWAAAKELRLRTQLRESAAKTWTRAEGECDWLSAKDAADVLLGLDPDNQGFLRCVMLSCAAVGRAEEAEAAYLAFRDRMIHTFGSWEPDEETDRLKARAGRLLSGKTVGSEHKEGHEPPLVGRSTELRQVLSTAMERGRGCRSILVLGEAGIGKTRLIREALTSSALKGVRPLYGSCYELEASIPMNPIMEALSDQTLESTLSGPTIELDRRTVTESRCSAPPAEWPPSSPADLANLPRSLYEEVLRRLVQLARDQPVLLVVDDIHWMDTASAAALHFVMRRWTTGDLTVVLVARSEALKSNRSASALVDALKTQGSAELQLEPLSAASAARLASTIAGSALSRSTVEKLCRYADNIPLLLIELASDAASGALDIEGVAGSARMPTRLVELITRRASSVGPNARDILNLLAGIGRPSPIAELQSLTDLDKESISASIEELFAVRLVAPASHALTFRHESIRSAFYWRLSTAERSLLHHRIAHILSVRSGTPSSELAIHLHLAGHSSEAAGYAQMAAQEAERVGAFEEAIRFYEIFLAGTSDPTQTARLTAHIGRLHLLQRDLTNAVGYLEKAASSIRIHGRLAEALETELNLLLSDHQINRTPQHQNLIRLERIKAEAKSENLWVVVARALDAQLYLSHGAQPEGARTALSEAREVIGHHPLADCIAHMALTINQLYGDPQLSLAASQEAIRIADRYGFNEELVRAYARLTFVVLTAGLMESEDLQQMLSRAMEVTATSGDLGSRFSVISNTGVWHLDVANFGLADQFFDQAEKVLRTRPDAKEWITLRNNQGELLYELGYYEEAASTFSAALSLNDGRATIPGRVSAGGLGLCALRLGLVRQASQIFDELGVEADFPYDPLLPELFRATFLLKVRRRSEAALDLLQRVGDQIEGRFLPGWVRLKIAEARMARSTSQKDRSREVAEEALEGARQIGARNREMEALDLL